MHPPRVRTVVLAFAAAALVAGCGNGLTGAAPAPSPSVPGGVLSFEGSQPGHDLHTRYEYTPVEVGNVDTRGPVYVWVVCPGANLTDCAANYANHMSAKKPPRPGVVENSFHVVDLILPAPKAKGVNKPAQFYYVDLPPGKWQNFSGLKASEQLALLRMMPAVVSALGGDAKATINVSPVGVTTAGRVDQTNVSSLVTG